MAWNLQSDAEEKSDIALRNLQALIDAEMSEAEDSRSLSPPVYRICTET